MSCTRKQYVSKIQSWVGMKESDRSHREIIDIYNSIKPLPVGYKLSYSDPWCAGTVSAAAQACGATDIIPTECSCPRMIAKAQKMGIWVENDAHIPESGDIIMYDWQDSGSGDNRGSADHVGVVENVEDGIITVIEGNYKDAVTRRKIIVDGRYIRGYIVPKFDPEASDEPAKEDNIKEPVSTSTGYSLKTFIIDVQRACGASIDGIAGKETIGKTVTLSALKNRTHKAVKPVQMRLFELGYPEVGKADGIAGPKFTAAVKRFQKDNGCVSDGEITAGKKTWRKLLGMS